MKLVRAAMISVATLLAASGAALGQQYGFTVLSTGNNFSGDINVNSTFTGSLIGQYLTLPTPVNLLLTRTIQGTSGGVVTPPTNQTISPILGSVTSSGVANTRPTGSFILKWTPAGNRVDLYQMNLDVLGTSADPTMPVNVTITNMPGFRARDPNYTYPNIPNILLPSLTIPLGTATLTSFVVTNTAPAFATATPTGGGSFTFSMTVQAQGDATFNVNGGDIPTSVPQVLTVTGFITPTSLTSAQASLSFDANVNEPVTPTPPTPPPAPFFVALPNPLTFAPPNANVLFTLFLTGGNTTLTGNVTVPGGGATFASLADVALVGGAFGADGQLTVDDIISFVNAFSDGLLFADVTSVGGPPSPPDGQLTVDDIIAFFNAFSDG